MNLQLARFPAKCIHFAEKESRQINMLEHVLVAKPLHTLAGHALDQADVNFGDFGHDTYAH